MEKAAKRTKLTFQTLGFDRIAIKLGKEVKNNNNNNNRKTDLEL